jgi:hypothetical protein
MIGFISTLVTSFLNHTYIERYRWFTHFQFTIAQALGFYVFTSRFLATDLSTETSTSNYSEVFLLFRLQSLWNLGTKNSSGLTPPAYDWLVTVLELILSLRSLLLWALCTDPTENTVYCWRHRLLGMVLTEPLLRDGLHNPVVPPLFGPDDIENAASSIVA